MKDSKLICPDGNLMTWTMGPVWKHYGTEASLTFVDAVDSPEASRRYVWTVRMVRIPNMTQTRGKLSSCPEGVQRRAEQRVRLMPAPSLTRAQASI